ncbi:hypothetical protein EV1_022727 [Malus domestica]
MPAIPHCPFSSCHYCYGNFHFLIFVINYIMKLIQAFKIMIHGLCKKKCKLDEACKYFEIMIDEGIPPYSSTVQMLSNQGIYR